MYTPSDWIMQESLNWYSFLVLTIVFIVDQAPSMPTNLEMFSMVTRRTVAQQKETLYKISEQQVYKYLVLLYNFTKCSTNNAQKKYKHHKMFGQMVILYCEKPV